MNTPTQSLPPYVVCPNSGMWLFHPGPEERALEQIQRVSGAMLKAAEAMNAGQLVPDDVLEVLRETSGG